MTHYVHCDHCGHEASAYERHAVCPCCGFDGYELPQQDDKGSDDVTD